MYNININTFFVQTSLPATHSNEQNNPCESLKIELCEKIERGDSNHYVLRKEYVLSCPLVTKGNIIIINNSKDHNMVYISIYIMWWCYSECRMITGYSCR